GRKPQAELLVVVEAEDVLGELRRDAADLGEGLGDVDADLDTVLRIDPEVTAEGLVGALEIVRHRSDHIDPAAALVAHEEVLALLAPVAARHPLLALEPSEEGPHAGVT